MKEEEGGKSKGEGMWGDGKRIRSLGDEEKER